MTKNDENAFRTACCASAEPEIACTLSGGDFSARVASIREIAQRHLRKSAREGLTLLLAYDPEGRRDVEDIVEKERRCCAFLDFEVRPEGAEVQVRISAPPAAAEFADELFAHFAPELARERQ